ncbi:MAG: LptE family protein [Gemmatales bacterium]
MKFVTTILFLTCLCLAGCSSEPGKDTTIFGYHMGSCARTDIKTVRVPIFRNTTFFRDIEYDLTQAVIKRIEGTTPYKVVNDHADAQLAGIIKMGTTHVGIQNELNEARTRDFTLVVEASYVDSRTGQDYFRPILLQPALPSAPQPASPNTDILSPPPVLPTAQIRPRIFSQTAPYAQEIGQSLATARQKVIDDLAVAIVNAMEMPW